jgi:ribosome maturation factor RimP
LEVTSPGVDRPLTEVKHWQRNVSRLVKVSLTSGESLEGRILEVNEQEISLQIKQRTRSIDIKDVAKALIQVEFRDPASRSK